ncbi:hypothetical protein H312_00840 [Anncaliia algerae PRA339]|uniref:Uncharacterized protein n=1 Tax=Anncaliia algerae PRA339 TaxID=1288291 RepID=A0A059F3J1_9MICR|nr:hypothetical protein H312_00840 [Anncaliia algerae PRA339]
MRLIQAPQLLRTNKILEQYTSDVNFTIDAYKCKFTKKQRKQFQDKGIYTYIKLALNISFPDYKFDDLELIDIKKSDINQVKDTLSFRLNNLLSNYESGVENALLTVFDSVMDIKNSSIYLIDKRLEMFCLVGWFTCFFLYNKKRKRLLLCVVTASKN